MISNIGGEICELPVLPLHDPIFLITKIRGAEPFGAILLIQVIFFVQAIESRGPPCRLQITIVLENHNIEHHAEFRQIIAALTQLFG